MNLRAKQTIIISLIFIAIISSVVTYFSTQKVVIEAKQQAVGLQNATSKTNQANDNGDVQQLSQNEIDMIVVSPQSTGGKVVENPANEQAIIAQTEKLQEKSPVNNENFNLDFDYDEHKFLVALKPGAQNAETEFNNWIAQNELSQIPLNNFIFRTAASVAQIKEELNDEQAEKTAQIEKLQKMSPVKSNVFAINYQEEARVFKVALIPFTEENQQLFKQWLVSNQLDKIPESFFAYY